MSTTRCEHGNVVSDSMGSHLCIKCAPEVAIERLRVKLMATVARLVRVDGGDSYTVASALETLAETGHAFDVEAFIAEEDAEAAKAGSRA